MGGTLRLLIVEDSQDDALLILRAVRQHGFEVQYRRVYDRQAFSAALADGPWDAILCDYSMPRFSGLDALEMLRECELDLPFILISGTIGEETAVSAMRSGAHDYLMKDNLARLGSALERELREAQGRRAARRLAQQNERLRALLDTAGLGIYVGDAAEDWRFVDCNRAAAENLGYTREELLQLGPADIEADLPLHTREERDQHLRALRDAGKPIRVDGIHRREDGTTFPVEVFVSATQLEGRTLTLALAHDITRRKAVQQQLERSERLSSLGQLAGGVAHDFNNMLSVILMGVDATRDLPDLPQAAAVELDEIQDAGRRAAALTSQLLAFGRKQVLTPVSLDVNALIEGLLTMIERVLGEDIRLSFHPARDLGRVLADPAQIEQVVLNLVLNARHAMAGGGRLVLRTGNTYLDEAQCRGEMDIEPGEFVELVVSDDGPGMPSDLVERIFEPFFTTRQVGAGTGLGLSTVYGVIKQSRGHIRVDSAPGRGTTFEIYLPRTVRAVPAVEHDGDDRSRPTGDATVLVVEDLASLRRAIERVLVRGGYEVLAAEDLDTAVRHFEAHDGRIHLLLTDVVLPGASGWEIAQRLLDADPALNVLFMSGHTADIIARHGILEEGAELLPKPFSPAQLLRRVEGMLDEDPPKARP